jgi:hypothetical protein
VNTSGADVRPGFDAAAALLDEPATADAWRADFDASAAYVQAPDLDLPEGEALARLCADFAFPEPATGLIRAHRSDWEDPRVRRLGAHVQWLVATRYTADGYARIAWPRAPTSAPLLYAHAALGLARRTATEQLALGIDPSVTRATLWDIGQQTLLLTRTRRRVGIWWLGHHLAHHLFRLGRLQFQRSLAAPGMGSIASGTPILDVHVPGDGPLDAEACDVSFAWAAVFFAAHFPQHRARYLTCTSWLLDPQLTELLGADSNIARFQRRFELLGMRDEPSRVFEFVFDRPDLDTPTARQLAELPRDSRLRSALIEHHVRGGRIRQGLGVIPVVTG